MSTSSQDNRVRFPAGVINFASEVGVTGQQHDNYPAVNAQARFDWMRMFLIGLLSLQSSTEEPTQFRQGTPWFDLGDNTLKIRIGDVWEPAAKAIALGDGTLASFFTDYQALVNRVAELEGLAGRVAALETKTRKL